MNGYESITTADTGFTRRGIRPSALRAHGPLGLAHVVKPALVAMRSQGPDVARMDFFNGLIGVRSVNRLFLSMFLTLCSTGHADASDGWRTGTLAGQGLDADAIAECLARIRDGSTRISTTFDNISAVRFSDSDLIEKRYAEFAKVQQPGCIVDQILHDEIGVQGLKPAVDRTGRQHVHLRAFA